MRELERQRVPEERFLVVELKKLEGCSAEARRGFVSTFRREQSVHWALCSFVYTRERGFSDAAKVKSEPFLDLHEGEGFVEASTTGERTKTGPNCKESAAYSSPCRPSQGVRGRSLGRSMAQASCCAIIASRVRRSAHACAQGWWRLERGKIDYW